MLFLYADMFRRGLAVVRDFLSFPRYVSATEEKNIRVVLNRPVGEEVKRKIDSLGTPG